MHNVAKTYDFPNAHLHKMPDGSFREQPKWCLNISVPRDRGYVVGALGQLRRHRRTIRSGAAAGGEQ